jgi:hypothetical protein
MSTHDLQPDTSTSRRVGWAPFCVIALVPLLGGVAVLVYACWAPEDDVGVLTAIACLLITIALVTLLVPVISWLVFYAIIIPIWLALFVACDEIPLPVWPRRMRTFLRRVIIVSCFAWIVLTIPRACMSPTWRAFKDTALMGIVFPAGTILWLFSSRMEKLY